MAAIWEIKSFLDDARENLREAGRLAYEISADDGGTAACPEAGLMEDIPAVEGWPAMLALVDALAKVDAALAAAWTPELAEAAKAEADELDHLDGLADAASY